CQQANTLPRTF
nr:immunoglobulin light chain junction region [Mus musculus]